MLNELKRHKPWNGAVTNNFALSWKFNTYYKAEVKINANERQKLCLINLVHFKVESILLKLSISLNGHATELTESNIIVTEDVSKYVGYLSPKFNYS